MTSSQKRSAEENEPKQEVELSQPEPKKSQVNDVREKGVAPIKSEYIIDATLVSYNDDAAEDSKELLESEKGDKKRGKKRGQNKKRDLKQAKEDVRLCNSLIDPHGSVECRKGEKCPNVHDLQVYLSSKPEDIEGQCPVYAAIGYCPSGVKCRWLNTHYNKETTSLIKDLEKMEETAKTNYEINKVSNDTKFFLQRKRYEFKTSVPYSKYLNQDKILISSENGHKDKQEQVKENNASYVEAPFKASEKKKLDLRRAKIVSPLTTVGNLPYRRLMRTLGADVTYSEMALTTPLLQGTNAEWALPKAHASEYPGFGVQIASNNYENASKVAEILSRETSGVSELNLNCGCPIDLLFKQGQGSALMEQPSRLIRILNGMNACSGDIPVTLKIRTGVRDGKNVAELLVSKVLEKGDAAAITLHGRSRQQRYTKEADWEYIGQVGKVVNEWNIKKEEDKERSDTQRVNFVGNGDVFTYEDWYNGVETDGIDSVMVARGALIKPWIFEEVESQQYLDKSASERLELLRTYTNFALEHWGSDEYGVQLTRRFLLEFMSFTHRYIPVGILERLPPKLNQRPPQWKGRNELETLLGSDNYLDWIKVTEMFLGKAGSNFVFTPKHKSNSYEK